VILADGDAILPRHLNLSFIEPPGPEPLPGPWEQIDLSGTLTEVIRRVVAEAEKRKIEQVLKETENNKGRASEFLGISYKMLLLKLREHRIE
jgi:DNA-binding NtrC family response regulator